MRSHTRLLGNLAKAETGPIMEEKNFDKLITKEVARLVKQYQIRYERTDAICMEDELADRLFEAGLELAETLGIYCTSTHKRILFSRDELLTALRWAPSEIEIGTGLDKVLVKNRYPESSEPLVKCGSPVGVTIDEDLYAKVMQSYAQEPEIDTILGGAMEEVHGYKVKTHSPWEVLLNWREIELTKLALHRANRPGMAVGAAANSVSEVGAITSTSFDGFRQTDWHLSCLVSELKTNYDNLMRLTHEIKSGLIIHDFYNPIYGGLGGGAEGIALLGTAGIILMTALHMSTTHSTSPVHPFNNGSTSPEIVWAMSAAGQAITRNTHLMTCGVISPVGGPGTECLLYECASVAAALTVSGAARFDGPRSAVGVVRNHCSGLEAKFSAEVSNAILGMDRKSVNEFIKKCQERYVPLLNTLPIGKPFTEVYDVTTVQPTPEWHSVYRGVKKQLREFGIPLA
jgi:methylamine--corrinoid protein Co-methyltransferase